MNKACRILDGDAIVQFHSIIKDVDNQLKQLYLQQKENGTIKLPLIVYRGQTQWSIGELEKLKMSKGNLISMNTFLSTSVDSEVAKSFMLGGDKNTSVLFRIAINNPKVSDQLQSFAHISHLSAIEDEKEVLFSMSSVFKVISVKEDDCFWVIDLELTNCKEDKHAQKLMDEVKTYLYQISNKQLPFTIFKRLFTKTSDGYTRPLTELMKFSLADMVQLFIINVYRKERRMKKLIDEEPLFHALLTNSICDNVRSNEVSICLLFDLFSKFLYSEKTIEQETVSFDINDQVSLFCLGGFLLMTGDLDKSIRYFKMLGKNDLIDKKFREFLDELIRTIYILVGEKKLATEYLPNAINLSNSTIDNQTSTWFYNFVRSSGGILSDSTEEANQSLNEYESIMTKKQSDNDISEKVRLLLLGDMCLQQCNDVYALNHLEEALEIRLYLSTSTVKILNGAIYMLMSTAYQDLNNISKALNILGESLKLLKSLYPSTHMMFAHSVPRYGFYLLFSERSKEAIQYLEESLKNPHFFNDFNSVCTVYVLLTMAHMQCGDIDNAEYYCYKAFEYQSPTNFGVFIPSLLEGIDQFKQDGNRLGVDYLRSQLRMCLDCIVQKLLPKVSTSNVPPDIINEETCTVEKFMIYADYYRHREVFPAAEIFYKKALEKMTEIDSESIWNVFKKMKRMNMDDYDRYRDYFIEQYSKYDENNPDHFEIIAVLQIILYKFCLFQNEFNLAFDCLIYGTFMAIKILYYKINIDSNYIPNIFQYILHHDEIAKACSIFAKLFQLYSHYLIVQIQQFLSAFFDSYNLLISFAQIVYHPQIDSTLDQFKLKYNKNPSAKSIILFLDTLLQLLRQSIKEPEKSNILFSDQILEFLAKYTDETVPLFYLMKTLEHLLTNNTQDFILTLDKFRLNITTFEYYQTFKEKISDIFNTLEEDDLHTCLKNIAISL